MFEGRSYPYKLWFDVGIKRYTTHPFGMRPVHGCGLM